MTSYFKVNKEKWRDYKINDAFPMIDINKVYKCVSILESDTTDTILRVIIDEFDNYVYVPRGLMTPIETIRNNAINQIIDED